MYMIDHLESIGKEQSSPRTSPGNSNVLKSKDEKAPVRETEKE